MAAEQTLIPEPPERSVVLVGGEGSEVAWLRDDHGLKPDDLHRWWSLLGADGEADTWTGLLTKGPVERLYRQAEVDRLVTEAVAKVSARPVGDHLRENGGNCAHCGVVHSPPEWARLEDRLAEEGSDA